MTELLALVAEARRQLDLCNACRYCEGYCAVFPALERRSSLLLGDVTYLSNLCHDCRACYQACMYAPPHEFGVDIPAALGGVRAASYRHYAWPRRAAALLQRGPRATAVATLAGLLLALAAVAGGGGLGVLLRSHAGPGAFYQVVPWLAMMLPALGASFFALGVLTAGVRRFWRDAGGSGPQLPNARAWAAAVGDVVRLRFLSGGGPGCYDPDPARPSQRRRLFHQLVVYGFLADFLSTSVAALHQDVLGWLPPYPVLSLPVLLGSAGGAGMVAGCTGLLLMKRGAWAAAPGREMVLLDVAFLLSLDLAALSGLALLAFRDTPWMGSLLLLHLAVLTGLYLTFPYGKLVHATYRFAALLKSRVESAAETEATA